MKAQLIAFFISGTIMVVAVLSFTDLQAGIYEPHATLFLPERQISLEVVATNETQVHGLSDRKSLGENSAMLFTFESPDYYGIWMKDMKFSIDIIWLDASKKIVTLEKNVSPGTYPKIFYPTEKSSYVIEMNAGFAEKNNLKTGNSLNFSL